MVASAENTIGSVASLDLTDLPAVDIQRHGAALTQPTSVVRELQPHLMLPCCERVLPVHLEELEPQQVVTEGQLAVEGIQAPAAKSATLGDDDPLCWPFGNLDLGGNRERLVLGLTIRFSVSRCIPPKSSCRLPRTNCGLPARSALKRSIRRSSSGKTLYFAAST